MAVAQPLIPPPPLLIIYPVDILNEMTEGALQNAFTIAMEHLHQRSKNMDHLQHSIDTYLGTRTNVEFNRSRMKMQGCWFLKASKYLLLLKQVSLARNIPLR